MATATSNRPAVKVAALLSVILVAFWIATYFPNLVVTLIVSALVAFVLKPLVNALESRFRLRRGFSIAVVFVLTGTILVFAAIEFVPLAIDRIREMYDAFQAFPFDAKLAEAARDAASGLPFVNADTIVQKVHGIMDGGLATVGGGVGTVAGFAVNLAIVPFITYFILAGWDGMKKKLIERVPNKYFEMTLNVIYKIETDLVGYLRGWILDSIIIGLLSIVGYYIIGVKYAALIGVIAGVANLIPYVGPIVGAVPAFLVSVTQFGDFRLLLPIVIQTFAVQMIDNVMVQPLCFAKTVDMHPLTVILVLIVGNELMGVAGMLLAIPIATILKASAVETYWGLKNYQITA
ncbi:MAG TPA: AI-2E family transporter [Bacteroidota bacterium]